MIGLGVETSRHRCSLLMTGGQLTRRQSDRASGLSEMSYAQPKHGRMRGLTDASDYLPSSGWRSDG